MYDQDLLEIYREPLHFDPDLETKVDQFGVNASCGDSIQLEVQIQDDHFVVLKWRGDGCVISQVATSLLLDKIIEENLSVQQVLDMTVQDLLVLIDQTTISPGRIKCLTLSLNTLKKIIKGDEQE